MGKQKASPAAAAKVEPKVEKPVEVKPVEAKPVEAKPVETPVEDAESDEEEVPTLEAAKEDEHDEGGAHSRGEKKARKAVSKLGLTLVPGVKSISVRKGKNVCITSVMI